MSLFTNYTSSNEVHAVVINDVYKESKQSLFMKTPHYPDIMPKKYEALQYSHQTLM